MLLGGEVSFLSRGKSHGKSLELKEGQPVLTSTVKALECREHKWYAVHNVCGFLLTTFINSYAYKFIVPEEHFHADTIGASPAVTARKTVKLFKFLYSPTQRGPTIVTSDKMSSFFYQHNNNKGKSFCNTSFHLGMDLKSTEIRQR